VLPTVAAGPDALEQESKIPPESCQDSAKMQEAVQDLLERMLDHANQLVRHVARPGGRERRREP